MLYFRQLNDFPKVGTVTTKGKIEYLEDFCTFDTEWTNVILDGEEKGVGLLYLWQFCLFGKTVYGRTLDEFKEFMITVWQRYSLNNKRRLVIYVHNLGAEYQYIQSYFTFIETMAVAKRSVLKARTGEGFEFRCAMKLSNMGLAQFTAQMDVEHKKLSDYDYDGIRTPDTVLTDNELKYGEHDVLGLYEAVHKRMVQEKDDILTIPMTATGYVRRHMRDLCAQDKYYKKRLREQDLTEKQYMMMLKAFRGGNTHANRAYAGKIITNVRSYDKTSDYPSACIYELFPMGKFYVTDDAIKSIEQGYAVVMTVEFLNLRTKDAIPYLSLSKCQTDISLARLKPEIHKQALIIDNGRILRAKGWTRTTITDVDYQIIRDHYEWDGDPVVIEAYKAVKKPLPIPIRKAISDFFFGKTELKGVKGQEYYYNKSKNMLNSTYGMMVMAPVREIITIIDGVWDEKMPKDIKGELEKYYKRRSTFLAYQWGVWVTAYARKYLQEAIDICGDKIVYVDTDSCKFIDDPDICARIDEINTRIRSQAVGADVPSIARTIKDVEQILGAWDNEGVYEQFRTYGAKKYATVKNGEFEFTVAGLGKAAGGELKTMGDFVLGRTFYNSGRTIACYDDNTTPHEIIVDGKSYTIRSNYAIIDTTYTLGVSDDYLDLVKELDREYKAIRIDGKRKIIFKSSIGYDLDKGE